MEQINYIFAQRKKGELKILPRQFYKDKDNFLPLEGLEVKDPFTKVEENQIIAYKSGIIIEEYSGLKFIPGSFREIIFEKGVFKKSSATNVFKIIFPEFFTEEFSLIRKFKSKTELKPPTPIEDGFYIDEDIWYFLLRQVFRRKQVLLIGQSGSGKTELIFFLVKKLREVGFLDLNLSVFDMAVQNAEASFKGTLQIEKGNTFFKYSRFAKTVQQPNTLILLDEINRGDIEVQNILLPLLDSRRTLYIERSETEEIKVAEGTFFWATANIGIGFAGANTLDEALEQRFLTVKIDYIPKEKEIELLKKRTKVRTKYAAALVDLAEVMRKSETFIKAPSTRILIQTAELIADGLPFKQAVKYGIYSQLAANDMFNNSEDLWQEIEKIIPAEVKKSGEILDFKISNSYEINYDQLKNLYK